MPRSITFRAVVAVTAVTSLALLVAGGLLFGALHNAFGRAEATIRFLLAAMLVGAPVLLALAALASWYATRTALIPVRAITTSLARISASELSRRVPVPGAGDEVAELAGEVNRTLDRLERAVSRQRQFVSDASHELRNPIAAVLAALEVAEAHPEIDCRASVRQAIRDTQRLQAVAGDLLLLARLDSDAPRSDAVVDLTLLVAESIAGRRAPIRLSLAPDVSVRGDAVQLSRLLTNLLDNAQRHAASTVKVTLTPEVLLSVADDGPGVPPEDMERIFERFTRLDASRDRDSGGTGLGLPIVREIARSHGGSVVLAGPGPGAVFEVRLPPAL
ncbi:sensor histidine kinase [Nonomuraea sp. NPDC050556]|uniref:sensor histidine kinase n=1 Tax=Nonomuraea sp. NPDC050556 TaxID=3364369 RepID=UPI003790C2CF